MKTQFLCAKVQSNLEPPHFLLEPPHFVCFGDGTDQSTETNFVPAERIRLLSLNFTIINHQVAYARSLTIIQSKSFTLYIFTFLGGNFEVSKNYETPHFSAAICSRVDRWHGRDENRSVNFKQAFSRLPKSSKDPTMNPIMIKGLFFYKHSCKISTSTKIELLAFPIVSHFVNAAQRGEKVSVRFALGENL